jgi:hypothetical protein
MEVLFTVIANTIAFYAPKRQPAQCSPHHTAGCSLAIAGLLFALN